MRYTAHVHWDDIDTQGVLQAHHENILELEREECPEAWNTLIGSGPFAAIPGLIVRDEDGNVIGLDELKAMAVSTEGNTGTAKLITP